jgi:transposase
MRSVSHHVRDDVTPNAGFRRFEVLTGDRRRRSWSVDEKLAIVIESFSTRTSISELARRRQLNRNQLFQWRAQYRRGELGEPAIGSFVPITVAETGNSVDAASSPPGSAATAPMVEIVFGGATVRVPPGADPLTIGQVLAALRGAR